jgi:hypothetical protein
MPDPVARHVFIAMPCYTGTIHTGTFRCLLNEVLLLAEKGIKVSVQDEAGNAMIAHSRSLFCALFLESEATDMVFIDHDVTWEPGAMVRLMEHPVEMVAGIYPKRSDPIGFNVRYMQDQKEIWADPATGLIEVEGVPAGFFRISRTALEKMVVAYPEKRFTDRHPKKGFAWALFDNIHEGDAYFGEDYSFCRRYRQIGGRVWADPSIEMGHIGNKKFVGRWGDWLKGRAA